MRGIVDRAINERVTPGVNARVSNTYEEGDVVDVMQTVLGEVCDGENIWYKLNTGGYVWSGGVLVQRDFTALINQEDRNQFLISYRKIKEGTSEINLDTKDPADTLYFSSLHLPVEEESVRVNNLTPDVFAQNVLDSIAELNDERRHVFIYIHGYQMFSSLKLDLLSGFVLNYMTHKDNSIAKVIFLSWPGQGAPNRKTVDDRSIRAGQQFTANNLFSYFQTLSQRLRDNGKCLNLVVHSFGHQLLNGMLNPEPQHAANIPATHVFENIFLMAPDITHLTVKREPAMHGVNLHNYFNDAEGRDYHYEFSQLPVIANRVHVFYDKYDYLLYSSTKRFVDKGDLRSARTRDERLAITSNYRGLGNYGNLPIDDPINQRVLEPGFNYVDVQQLISGAPPADLSDYPFQNIRKGPGKDIDKVWSDEDYGDIIGGKIIFNAKRFPDHHRYLFTCKQVVEEVLRLL